MLWRLFNQVPFDEHRRCNKSTVSPLMFALMYCHINNLQRASGVGKPWPGGENRRRGRASHHEEFEAIGSFLLPYAALE